MPHMTGLQLAGLLRRDRPDMPVLLVTGYAEIDEDVNVQVPKLAKPFTLAELAAGISRMSLRSRNGGQILQFRGNGVGIGLLPERLVTRRSGELAICPGRACHVRLALPSK